MVAAVIESQMGLVLPSDDDTFDEQNHANANSTRIAGHTHGTGYGVPVVRGDSMHVTNGLTIDSGDLVIASGRVSDYGTGHSFFYDTTAGRWSLSDQLNVNGQVTATALSISGATQLGGALTVSGGLTVPHAAWVTGGAQGPPGVAPQNLLRKTAFGAGGGATYGAIQIGSGQSISLGVDVSAIIGSAMTGANELVAPNTLHVKQVNSASTDFVETLTLLNTQVGINNPTPQYFLDLGFTGGGYIAKLGALDAGTTPQLRLSTTAISSRIPTGATAGQQVLSLNPEGGSVEAGGGVRAKGWTPSYGSGSGAEVLLSGGIAVFQGVNRDTAAALPVAVNGTSVAVQSSGVLQATFGTSGNSHGAYLAFPSRIGPQLVLYDNGGGSGFGLGINSGELSIFGSTLVGFRNASNSAARNSYIDTTTGTYVGSLNGVHTAGSISDGVYHAGWVRVNSNGVGIYSNIAGFGISFGAAELGPRFYAGTFSNEYIQSRGRNDGLYRHTTGGNVTLDYNSFDGGVFNTGSYVYLPDLNQVYGREFFVKNVTGADFSVYVTNGSGIYDTSWRNPFILHQGDSITVLASAPYGGWMIV